MSSEPHAPARCEEGTFEIELRCPADGRSQQILRAFAGTVAHQAGFPDDRVAEIEMAVDEACSNVICHAYAAGAGEQSAPSEQPERFLWLRARLADDRLQFSVIDRGVGACRVPQAAVSLQDYVERGAEGGLGIFIIRRFMDEVNFDFPPGCGTVLTMTKYLKPRESA